MEDDVDCGGEDWEVAKRGVVLVLNNRLEEAKRCFNGRNHSLQLAAGYSYVTFLGALMTFEEGMLNEAQRVLKDVERRCAQNLGWLKSMKTRMFGDNRRKEELLEERTMLADCEMCLALLGGLMEENSASYVKSGWALRKAWRIYQSTYTDVLSLYKRICPVSSPHGNGGSPWRLMLQEGSASPESPTCPWQIPPGPSTPVANSTPVSTFWNLFASSAPSSPEEGMSPDDVKRLMGAVSFGYGLFHLVVSLLPPSVLRLMQLLGFAGDRAVGLDALMFARLGSDMRAPLATLTLLWYHTIVRPFYAVDGHNICAGADAANLLLLETKDQFNESSIFLFFKGRIHRLKNEVEEAVRVFTAAARLTRQRELDLLCHHEMAWCYLVLLQFDQACATFTHLSHHSKWGAAFYKYCALMSCRASGGHVSEAEALAASRRKGNKEVEVMVSKRLERHFSKDHQPFYYRLLVYELLYLWNNLPYCTHTLPILTDCEVNSEAEEPMLGLRALVRGACLATNPDTTADAQSSFHQVLRQRHGLPTTAPDAHIDVFAYYELANIKLAESTPEGLIEADGYLQRISYYRDYDLEHQVSFRIHSAIRKARMQHGIHT